MRAQNSTAQIMKLPREIFPNPLLTSKVEVRFVSKLQSDEILGLAYPKFSSVLPTLRNSELPKEMKLKNDQLKYAPDFIMSNTDYSLSFSNNAIAFENVGGYKLWGNYYPFICQHLEEVIQLGIIDCIQVINVRYASLFDGEFSLETVIKPPEINLVGYKEAMSFFNTVLVPLNYPDYTIHLQVARSAKAEKGDISKSGILIDINASYSNKEKDANVSIERLYAIIDELHAQEKELFYTLLRPEFLASLNPKY